MWRTARARPAEALANEKPAPSRSMRDRLATVLAAATAVILGAILLLSSDTKFLMPGPLASPHATIEKCSTCHTRSGEGKLTWVRGLAFGDRRADSNACLTCHKMGETAFNPHGASEERLKRSTQRLTERAGEAQTPHAARFQEAAFPAGSVIARGLYCATCHQEHQGSNFDLARISNEQCRSCHVVKFDSFDGYHPTFDGYPFKRRSRIIYDHAGHFEKHFPEVAQKTPGQRIPDTCASCHDSSKDKRVMAVAPFAHTCASCHLDQIVGKERMSGPKGIAFLTVPGLDTATLKARKAAIGEWPDNSEEAITPFMKLLIGRNERGRALLNAVGALNLLDLSGANDGQIEAVVALVWEIKSLFHALIKDKASDVLDRLNVSGAEKLEDATLVELTASVSRDVIVGAHQQWLPNLGTEMRGRPPMSGGDGKGWSTTITQTRATVDRGAGSVAGGLSVSRPNRPPAARKPLSLVELKSSVATGGRERATEPAAKSADQTDDLLNLTEEERRMVSATRKGGAKTGAPGAASDAVGVPGTTTSPSAEPVARQASEPASPAPEIPKKSIESTVDAEAWATYGGWYRQDHAIFYRPTGHKDRFISAWLAFTGPRAGSDRATAEGAVFDMLTNKDAQGSCTKCHSVDDVPGKGRIVNFAPPSGESKHGRFTNFIHEPHLGVVEPDGCLTCHKVEKDRAYLQSYEKGNPAVFQSGFSNVSKDTCQSCHARGKARQDCLTCHSYHVDKPLAPMMSTRNPRR